MFKNNFLGLIRDEANPEGGDGGGGAKPVSYESHQKLLGEKKAAADKLKAAEARLAELEQSDLENKGKLQEALDAQKKKANELTEKNLNLVKKLSERAIKTQFKLEVAGLGCIDPDLAFKACDFSDMEITEDLEFDQATLTKKVQELAKGKPHLFKKPVNLPANHNPTNKASGEGGAKSLDEMTDAELKQALQAATTREKTAQNQM